MSLSLKPPLGPLFGVSFIAVIASLSAARADSAYIQQASGTTATYSISTKDPSTQVYTGSVTANRATVPEDATPKTSATNYAKSLTVGSSNTVAQFQTGGNDTSIVSAIGSRDTVGVVQGGNTLSNVAVAGTGLNVTVLQPNNSAPINMFVARLPNGTILIKR